MEIQTGKRESGRRDVRLPLCYISFDSALVSCQHIPHSLSRFLLCGSGNVSVGIQDEAGGVMTQYAGDSFDVYTVLQSQGGKGMAQIMEAKLRQPARFNTRWSMWRTVSGEIGPPVGEGNTYSLRVCFSVPLSIFALFNKAYDRC